MNAFLAPVAIAAAVLLAPVAAFADTAHVGIKDFMFTPATITVPQGTTVQWINLDDIPHTVVEKNKAFRSKALDTDDAYSFTFASAGTFDYFCGLHPYMVGKIIVK